MRGPHPIQLNKICESGMRARVWGKSYARVQPGLRTALSHLHAHGETEAPAGGGNLPQVVRSSEASELWIF